MENIEKQEREQELANKIKSLIEEKGVLYERHGNGVTLEKAQYIGKRLGEIEEELGKLKTPKKCKD